MLIISDFKDYYDYIQKSGIDRKLVYERHTKFVTDHGVEIPSTFKCCRGNNRSHPSYFVTSLIVVGFCGNIYKMFGIEDKIFQTKEEVENFVEETFSERAKKCFRENLSWYKNHNWLIKHWVQNWFENQQIGIPQTAWNIPVWKAERRAGWRDPLFLANPILCDSINFQRIKDAQTAYQEIAMYLTAKEPKIPAIDDKTMAQAKGFNRWSFRKESTKKK